MPILVNYNLYFNFYEPTIARIGQPQYRHNGKISMAFAGLMQAQYARIPIHLVLEK